MTEQKQPGRIAAQDIHRDTSKVDDDDADRRAADFPRETADRAASPATSTVLSIEGERKREEDGRVLM